MRILASVILLGLCCTAPVWAQSEMSQPTETAPQAGLEPVPNVDVFADFDKNCMGDKTAETDPGRANYCACVHKAIANWDADKIKNVSDQQNASPQKTPAELEEVAKGCYTDILH